MNYKNNYKNWLLTSTISYLVDTAENLSYNAVFSYKIDFIQIILTNIIWGFGVMGVIFHFCLYYSTKYFNTTNNSHKTENPIN